MSETKLTKAQKAALAHVVETGFAERRCGFGTSQPNRPMWALESAGLVEFGWGPVGSMLKTQGFLPTDAGRAAIAKATGEAS